MFYDQLVKACEQNGVKVSPTVVECGGAIGSINGWKKGRAPSSDIVVKLALRLNVTTDFLLLDKEKSPSADLSEDRQRLLEMYDLLSDMERGEILGELKLMTRGRTAQEDAG